MFWEQSFTDLLEFPKLLKKFYKGGKFPPTNPIICKSYLLILKKVRDIL